MQVPNLCSYLLHPCFNTSDAATEGSADLTYGVLLCCWSGSAAFGVEAILGKGRQNDSSGQYGYKKEQICSLGSLAGHHNVLCIKQHQQLWSPLSGCSCGPGKRFIGRFCNEG